MKRGPKCQGCTYERGPKCQGCTYERGPTCQGCTYVRGPKYRRCTYERSPKCFSFLYRIGQEWKRKPLEQTAPFHPKKYCFEKSSQSVPIAFLLVALFTKIYQNFPSFRKFGKMHEPLAGFCRASFGKFPLKECASFQSIPFRPSSPSTPFNPCELPKDDTTAFGFSSLRT